ncbi:FMN-binding protein [Skermania sp. ID1734]|uniref:FMN-binding protein n=1 Tax=Skermania sp. ID1734 TaxID=2597516 RepID=UPI00117D6A3C|nr:FMN-binding protein [Skermania sp. ID1734]TSE00106.1 FMN-binding protein [Skermania sp. ID1734]
MRRITMGLLATLSSLVLLFSYRTSTSSHPTPAPTATTSAVATTATSNPAPAQDVSLDNRTVTGTAVDTRYGPVQVQITVSGGKITAATATQVPDNIGREREIVATAVPVLEQETVQAQSADIDMVSGASYTSEGYVESLQSAIDQANLR